MFYIIGVHHGVQFDKKYSLTQKFISYFKDVVRKLRIEVIAEESSEDALKKWGIEKTFVQKISENKSSKYIACDPNITERKTLGIRSDEEIKKEKGLPNILTHQQLNILDQEKIKDFIRREKHWLKKIKDYSDRQIIFICGLRHLDTTLRVFTFQDLLSTNSYKYTLLKKF